TWPPRGVFRHSAHAGAGGASQSCNRPGTKMAQIIQRAEKTMPQPLPPQQQPDERPDGRAHEAADADGVLEPVESLLDLLNELNRHLDQLEYALLDLREALVACDRGERGKLEREANAQLERIRIAAKNDPGFPRLIE